MAERQAGDALPASCAALIRTNSRILRTSGLRGLMRRQTAFVHARLSPQLGGGLDRIDAGVLPPGCLVADAMDQPMMDTAERDRELVAGLAAKRPRLQVAQVMRVRGLAAADQAGLLGDVTKMLAVAIAPWRRNGEHALVYAGRAIAAGSYLSR